MSFVLYDADSLAAWGIGETEEDARDDAQHWLNMANETATLSTAKVTQEVCEQIRKRGGQVLAEFIPIVVEFTGDIQGEQILSPDLVRQIKANPPDTEEKLYGLPIIWEQETT